MYLIIGGVVIAVFVAVAGGIAVFANILQNELEPPTITESQLPATEETMVEETEAIPEAPDITQAVLPDAPLELPEEDILPTEPPVPETAEDLNREIDYLDVLINNTASDGFSEETLDDL